MRSQFSIRLARSEERLVMWLEGHGERSLTQQANHDLGNFGTQLRQKGIRLGPLNLALAPEVPDNAALLIIAGPRVQVGEADGRYRVVRSGLREGDSVLLFPGSDVADGVKIKPRKK